MDIRILIAGQPGRLGADRLRNLAASELGSTWFKKESNFALCESPCDRYNRPVCVLNANYLAPMRKR